MPGRPYPDEHDRLRSRVPAPRARHGRCRRPHGVARATPAPRRSAESGPVTLPQSAGGVTAVKFRDPEGHPLEFLAISDAAPIPTGAAAGIMGIDHSAISVSDVAASRRFYARHGLSEADATVNHGPTQDALDGLDGVEVDVVPMNPADKPPHVELLGYRHPDRPQRCATGRQRHRRHAHRLAGGWRRA